MYIHHQWSLLTNDRSDAGQTNDDLCQTQTSVSVDHLDTRSTKRSQGQRIGHEVKNRNGDKSFVLEIKRNKFTELYYLLQLFHDFHLLYDFSIHEKYCTQISHMLANMHEFNSIKTPLR